MKKYFILHYYSKNCSSFEELGVDTVFVVHFTSDFAKLSPAAFIDTFIRGLNIQTCHTAGYLIFHLAHLGKARLEDMRCLKQWRIWCNGGP
ncbi:Riboflavin biosynthesis protein OS=Lysinibacillus sphaericus OX=1421 GN=ribF PE=3 SV=1 [Lysinibacillus sphaericus]